MKLQQAKARFGSNSQSSRDNFQELQLRFGSSRLMTKQDVDILTGRSVLVAEQQSAYRRSLVPSPKRKDLGFCKLEYAQHSAADPHVFRRQNGELTNYANEASMQRHMSRSQLPKF